MTAAVLDLLASIRPPISGPDRHAEQKDAQTCSERAACICFIKAVPILLCPLANSFAFSEFSFDLLHDVDAPFYIEQQVHLMQLQNDNLQQI